MKHSTIMWNREWVMGEVALGLAAGSGAAEPEPWGRFSGDGQQIVVEAKGGLTGGFADGFGKPVFGTVENWVQMTH